MNETEPILQRYLKDIEQYERIDSDKEKELARIIHESGDEEKAAKAKEELVVANLRLVVKIAMDCNNMIKGMQGQELTLMDLINEGNIGLMRAADLFKADKGVNFSTYSFFSIQRRIKRAIKQSRLMRLPVNHFKHMATLKSLEEEYHDRKDELTDELILKKLNITAELLDIVRSNRDPTLSIDELDEMIGEPFVANYKDDSPQVDELVSNKQLKDYLYEKIKELKPNYRDILFMKFFSNTEMTLEEMGQRQGLTRERVRQIINQGIRALRQRIVSDASKARLSKGDNAMIIWNQIKGNGSTTLENSKNRRNKKVR